MSRPRHEANIESLGDLTLDDDRPKGEQIQAKLGDFVQSARPGLLLPSERILAERFGVARMTVRNCIEELERQGLVRRAHGRGTFVRERRLIHSDIFRSFSEDMRLRGMEPGARELTIRRRKATSEVATKLGVQVRDEIFHIQRIRTADGLPMALERTNLSAARFPGLDREMEASSSLYDILGRRYGVRLETAEQRISIARISASDAARMEISPDTPVFLIERTTLGRMGDVVEFGSSLYRGDRYEIFMHVSRAGQAHPRTNHANA